MSVYTPIIGLEVHVELKTASKMFCTCSADYFGKKPNTHTCPVCLGLPGALPVPNKKALDSCIMIALALNCKINKFSKFDRKNYFYADLPKGYQISQYDLPFGENGWIELQNKKRVRIRRVHMEEDTAKLTHAQHENLTLIDFNRSGVPLVEIVTEPDFHDARSVKEYLQKLQEIVRYLDVSNADMEKGDMRLEPNISLTNDPKVLPLYKVEVKNINSFRFVEKAINYELERQKKILEKGKMPVQETRGYNEAKNLTVSQRIKEEAHDYRYFPEPDIPPVVYTDEEISTLKLSLPELRDSKKIRFLKEYALPEYDSEILTRQKETADFFEATVKIGKEQNLSPKQIANAIINKQVDLSVLSPQKAADLIAEKGQKAEIDEKQLAVLIKETLAKNPKAVADYQKGKETVIMYLVGQVMRGLGTKADALAIKEKLISELKKDNGRNNT